MRPLFQACLITIAILLSGCAGNIGSNQFPLTIRATVNGADVHASAYLVPNIKWELSSKNLDDPVCRQLVAEYPVAKSKTPVTIHGVSAHKMAVIVEYQGHWKMTSFVPGDEPTVTIELE